MADRARNFQAVLYPESLEPYPYWKEMLRETGVPMAISPLHDRDVFTELDEWRNPSHRAGMPKKAHYHVNMYFDSVKTIQQAHGVLETIGGVNSHCLKKIEHTVKANRYLAHMDDPDKAQYSPHEIVLINGARCDLADDRLTKGEQDELRNEIVQVIQDQGFMRYHDLYLWTMETGDVQMQRFVAGHIHFFETFLKDKRYQHQDGGV